MKENNINKTEKIGLATFGHHCKELFNMLCKLDYEALYKLGQVRNDLAVSLSEVEVLCEKKW